MTATVIAIQSVLGMLYTATAGFKLARHPHMVEDFQQMRLPYLTAYLSAAAEIICGPALLAGIWVQWLVAPAAAVLTLVMICAAIVSYPRRKPWKTIGVTVLAVLCAALTLYYYPDLSDSLAEVSS
ncbi:DoxX family protein [Nocardia sp. NPDC060256]|uniref:DoxX family protein n=1 Tax=unclassified Nocardia TaxID=2637762 RepID=UPI0036679A67